MFRVGFSSDILNSTANGLHWSKNLVGERHTAIYFASSNKYRLWIVPSPFHLRADFFSAFGNLYLHISLLKLKGQNHSPKLWNFSAQLIASTAAIKSSKEKKLHFSQILNFSLLVMLGNTRMILKFIFQILIANSKDNFKHDKVHWFSAVLLAQGRLEMGKVWDFLGLCLYLLFISFLLMANTNSHRS